MKRDDPANRPWQPWPPEALIGYTLAQQASSFAQALPRLGGGQLGWPWKGMYQRHLSQGLSGFHQQKLKVN